MKLKAAIFAALLPAVVLAVSGCKSAGSELDPDPRVSTTGAVVNADGSVSVSGKFLDSDDGEDLEVGVCMDTVSGPHMAQNKVGSGLSADRTFRANFSGLSNLGRYYFRAYAIRGNAVGYGAEVIVEHPVMDTSQFACRVPRNQILETYANGPAQYRPLYGGGGASALDPTSTSQHCTFSDGTNQFDLTFAEYPKPGTYRVSWGSPSAGSVMVLINGTETRNEELVHVLAYNDHQVIIMACNLPYQDSKFGFNVLTK